MIVEVLGRAAPLCPNVLSPQHPAHLLRTRMLDVFSAGAESDADGELPAAVQEAYDAVAHGPGTGDRLLLYTENVTVIHAGRTKMIESWWFRCPVCGLVVPAAERG